MGERRGRVEPRRRPRSGLSCVVTRAAAPRHGRSRTLAGHIQKGAPTDGRLPPEPEILYSVKAQRGPTLRCKGWKQETILRMLENNMENAEKPEELVIYGGIGKCARNWESYHAIVNALKELEDDETLVVQSGMPVAVFETHRLAPRVVMANTNIMKATWPIFYDLQDKNLTMFAQYTAGPWEYIGTQGVIQGTFETFSAIARKCYDDSLVGRILLTAGAGGMGGNQTRAMTMHGGVGIVVDADERVIDRRIEKRVHRRARSARWTRPSSWRRRRPPRASRSASPSSATPPSSSRRPATRASARTSSPRCARATTPSRTSRPGSRPQEADVLRVEHREEYLRRARETMMRQLRVMNRFFAAGVPTFEYGTSIRKECRDAGMPEAEAMTIPGFVERVHPAAVLRGPRPVPLDLRER